MKFRGFEVYLLHLETFLHRVGKFIHKQYGLFHIGIFSRIRTKLFNYICLISLCYD